MNTNLGSFRSVLFTILVFASFVLSAQEIVVEDRYDEVFAKRPAPFFSLHSDANVDDLTLGGTIGVINGERNWMVAGSFDIRPYKRRVFEYDGNNTFYQLRQERFMVGSALTYHKPFNNADFGGFVQMNLSYMWGKYGGTIRKPEKGWVLIPRMGLYCKVWRSQTISLGYSYKDMKDGDIAPHCLYLSFSSLIDSVF